MVADRKFSLDGSPAFHAPKIWRHKGDLYSSAGKSGDWMLFQRWIIGEVKDRPVCDEDTFSVLRLSKDGLWYYDYSCYPVRMDETYFAIGAGDTAAMCLMDQGLSPAQAIEAIKRRSDSTGGTVDVVYLKEEAPVKTSKRSKA